MTKSNENTNAVTTTDALTGEVLTRHNTSVIVSETDEFAVMLGEDGKFVRKAKYQEYSSVVAETREDKIWLLNLMDSDEDSGLGKSLKENVGKEIEVENLITRKYDSVDEDTGELIYGVLTYLITPDKEVYVTSSKSVYFSMKHITDLFGQPHEANWENVTLLVGSVKMLNGTGLTIKMIK